MAGTKKVVTQQVESAEAVENLILEQRKVKALEKIANSLDALTVWFEEIEKPEPKLSQAYIVQLKGQYGNLQTLTTAQQQNLNNSFSFETSTTIKFDL